MVSYLKTCSHHSILYFISHKIDIACITETHLVSSKILRIPGYKCYRADRPNNTPSGGVMILIKTSINSCPSFLPFTPGVETISAKISLMSGDLIVISAYKPPNKSLVRSNFWTLFSSNTSFILLGDLNSKHTSWGCRSNSPDGIYLHNLCQNYNLKVIAPVDPTHYPYNQNCLPDILDIAITNTNIPLVPFSIPELDSDHNPVILTAINTRPIINRPPRLLTQRVNWRKFQQHVTSSLPPIKQLKTQSEIDESTFVLTNTIVNAIQNSSPNRVQAIHAPNHRRLPESIQVLITRKNKMRRLWIKHRLPHLKSEYNHLIRLVRNALALFHLEEYKKYVADLNPQDASLWKATRRLLGTKSVIPVLKNGHLTARNDQEKAEMLADYFASTFQTHNISENFHNESLNLTAPLISTLQDGFLL